MAYRHSERIRVAVIGGGCASMAAAFELTRPEHRGRYEVTIYQRGWRLGGKGASGRRSPSQRIEEHGLHVWLGYYENAFRLLRECYAELGRDPRKSRFADWRDAFCEETEVALVDSHTASGDERLWRACFPVDSSAPGDPFERHHPFSLPWYLGRVTHLLSSLLLSAFEEDPPPSGAESPLPLGRQIRRLIGLGRLGSVAALVEALRLLELALSRSSSLGSRLLLQLTEKIGDDMQKLLSSVIQERDELRRTWQMMDLMLTLVRGLLKFGVLQDPRGLDALNIYDARQWFGLAGAGRECLSSPFVRGLYDLCFAYADGDLRRPAMEAGTFIRGLLRLFFTYRGAVFWKMRAGMGDVVFAPFYQVLRRRGVAFRFFHRLDSIRLGKDVGIGEKAYVKGLEFEVQAKVQGGGEYEPLIDVKGLDCWPAEPKWELLQDGDGLARSGVDLEQDERSVSGEALRLSVGKDFDFVVLGVGLGAIPTVCRELIERDERWRQMIERLRTTATQAFQIWLSKDLRELGWQKRPVTFTGFPSNFSTWSDMRQVLAEEIWPDPQPEALLYFCGPMVMLPFDKDSRILPAVASTYVKEQALAFIENQLPRYLPRLVDRDGFRWDLLCSHSQGVQRGRERFDGQFWTGNVDPSDLYVLSVPDSSRFRVSPLDNTYDNLTVAGDWTNSGLNFGCVEAAIISGRLAAHAISSQPGLDQIIGYDHP